MMITWPYIAGFYDGEGCFRVYKYDNRRGGKLPRGSHGRRAYVTVNQLTKNKKVLTSISKFLFAKNIKHLYWHPLYRGTTRKPKPLMSVIQLQKKSEICKFLKPLLPHLIVKHKDATKVYKFCLKGTTT